MVRTREEMHPCRREFILQLYTNIIIIGNIDYI